MPYAAACGNSNSVKSEPEIHEALAGFRTQLALALALALSHVRACILLMLAAVY